MKYKYLFLLVPVVIVLGIFLLLQPKASKTPQDTSSPQPTSMEKTNTFQTQTDNKGVVTIEATPISLSAGKEASFQLKFTTHSIELDYKLGKISELQDDKGNIYKAISWSGGSGGHHLSGVLMFPKISEQARSVTLVIPNIDTQDRKFTWNL